MVLSEWSIETGRVPTIPIHRILQYAIAPLARVTFHIKLVGFIRVVNDFQCDQEFMERECFNSIILLNANTREKSQKASGLCGILRLPRAPFNITKAVKLSLELSRV